jgi:hypothetical protein
MPQCFYTARNLLLHLLAFGSLPGSMIITVLFNKFRRVTLLQDGPESGPRVYAAPSLLFNEPRTFREVLTMHMGLSER